MSKQDKDHKIDPEPNEEQASSSEMNSTEELVNPIDVVAKYEALVKELNEKYVRLYAEYDNFRRRTQKEKGDMIKYAGEEIIVSILPIVDDMERAISHHKDSKDHKPLHEGLDLIYQKLKKTLTAKGVESMDPKGEVFNPDLQDAITNIPAATENLKGTIADVVEKGYTLNGKVIRHAKVVVAN
jgi:molecular chaperone GrpE